MNDPLEHYKKNYDGAFFVKIVLMIESCPQETRWKSLFRAK